MSCHQDLANIGFEAIFETSHELDSRDIAGVLVRHVVDEGVDLPRQMPHDGQGRHVQGNSGKGGRELVTVVISGLGQP